MGYYGTTLRAKVYKTEKVVLPNLGHVSEKENVTWFSYMVTEMLVSCRPFKELGSNNTGCYCTVKSQCSTSRSH